MFRKRIGRCNFLGFACFKERAGWNHTTIELPMTERQQCAGRECSRTRVRDLDLASGGIDFGDPQVIHVRVNCQSADQANYKGHPQRQ
jgi:hypothetical protein